MNRLLDDTEGKCDIVENGVSDDGEGGCDDGDDDDDHDNDDDDDDADRGEEEEEEENCITIVLTSTRATIDGCVHIPGIILLIVINKKNKYQL